ncbi:hypothetical protein VKT23_020555 [Stygiomarasmius scandens]|uniref:Uncharacterized protein n=1 Tax=Marasmiellus scandens TaxID=2682957 RepID=A0ABR1IIT9_9AGAR
MTMIYHSDQQALSRLLLFLLMAILSKERDWSLLMFFQVHSLHLCLLWCQECSLHWSDLWGTSARSSSALSAACASQRNNNSTTRLHPTLYSLEAPELADERSIQVLVAALDTGPISEDGELALVSPSDVNTFLDVCYSHHSESGTGPSRRSYDVRWGTEQEVEDNGEGEWEDECNEHDAANTTSSSIPISVHADEQDPDHLFSSNQVVHLVYIFCSTIPTLAITTL